MWTLTAREVHDHTVVPKRRQDQEHLIGHGNRVRETLGEDELAHLRRQGAMAETQPELNTSLEWLKDNQTTDTLWHKQKLL